MKPFAKYLAESEKTYNYRIKIVGDVPNTFVKELEGKLTQFDIVKISKPTAKLRSINFGSVKLNDISELFLALLKSNSTICPLPKKLYSDNVVEPIAPEAVLYPIAKRIDPVDVSFTLISKSNLSNSEVGLFSNST